MFNFSNMSEIVISCFGNEENWTLGLHILPTSPGMMVYCAALYNSFFIIQLRFP